MGRSRKQEPRRADRERRLPAAGDDLRAARRELGAIVRAACARLIAEAALLRAGWSPFGAFAPELVALPYGISGWRAAARETLKLLGPEASPEPSLEPSAEPSLGAPLARLLATRAVRWPKASRLARLALRWAPSERGHLVLAQAWLAEGECARARRTLAGVLARDPARDVAWRAYAGLAFAHESRGNDRLAGAAYWSASAIRGVGAEPLVDGLFLALSLGEFARARAACERLDRLAATDPASMRDLGASLQRLDRRRGLRVDAEPRAAVAALARSFAEGSAGPSALVARMFLGGRA